MAEAKEKAVEDVASDTFNALPFEERKRICQFMNMARIQELKRQKAAYRAAINGIDETIRLTREWMTRKA